MKPKTIILLVVALGCGLGASIMTSRLLAERQRSGEPEPTVAVVTARARVVGYTTIKEPEKAFEVRQVPLPFAPKHPISSLDDLKGQKLNKSIVEGHMLLKDDLLSKEQAAVIDQLLPGQRAVAIKVNPESLGGGCVLQGSRVDVMCTMQGNESSAKLILQNMLVMAVDDQDVRNPDKKFVLGQTVTLAATPEEAGRLSLAAKLGELRLLPKSPGDTTRIAQFEVKPDDLKKPSVDRSKSGGGVAKPSPATATPVLPVLPPVVDKKPEPVVVAKVAPRKPSRHTMRIITGSSMVKAVFTLGEKKNDDEDEESSGSEVARPEAKPQPQPQPRPVATPATSPQARPAAPLGGRPTTRVGRTRTGS